MVDEKRPVPLNIYCSRCNYCFARKVSTYMRTGPQQEHITNEIYFDSAEGFDEMNLKETNLRLRSMAPGMGVPEEALPDLNQFMYNCPEDCASEDDKMVIAKGPGFLVETRGFTWAAAIADGLCHFDEV